MSFKNLPGITLLLITMFISAGVYSQPRLTINQAKPKQYKKGDPIDYRAAKMIAGTAFQNILDVPDMDKLSSSAGQEEQGTPEAYFTVTFQTGGNPLYIGHVYNNGNIKFLFKMSPIGNTKQAAIDKAEAKKIASNFITEKLGASLKQYSIISVEKEKAAKGILAFYEVKIKRTVPAKNNNTVASMDLKIHPKSKEIMSATFGY